MKKFLTRIFATVVCAGVMLSTAISAAAEYYYIDPQYPIHGNKCGTVVIRPEIDRAVAVTITQLTQDGDYVYYDTVIPAGGENTGLDDYLFELEGKDDVTYRISLGVPKYKGSEDYQMYEYEFIIADTDNIVDGSVNKYIQCFFIQRNDELEAPELTSVYDETVDEENNVWNGCVLTFPASDIIPGDADLNEIVDLYDVIAIARYLMNPSSLNEAQIAAGDFNLDGKTDLYDAIDISKKMMGIE